MMLMKQIIEVELEIFQDAPKGHVSYASIELLFSKKPTKEQLVEATRAYLTEHYGDYDSKTALQYMNLAEKCAIPEAGDVSEGDDGVIFSNKVIYFEIVEE